METKQPENQTRKALGKGLASLLPNAKINFSPAPPLAEAQPVATNNTGARIPGIAMVEIEQITPNQFQPRQDFRQESLQELAESIRANGIIQPLVARRGADGKLQLIAGERRLRAAKIAGLKQVPVVIRTSSDKESLEMALIENVQREDLNCVDVALSYYQLTEDFRLTQEEVAKRVGKDRTSVANHMRLLRLPEEVIKDLRDGQLSYGHGRALLALEDPMQKIQVKKQIIEKNLSVRETEQLVTSLLSDEKKAKRAKRNDANSTDGVKELAERLGRAYGTKIKVQGGEHRGKIVLEFYSREDLDRIVEQMLR